MIEVRPALRCSAVVVDLKSLPGEVVVRSCRGKATHGYSINGDYFLAFCQRHPRRLERLVKALK